MVKGTTFTEVPLSDCPSCHSSLGAFVASPDGRRQVICSTCGMRGPYQNMTSTAEERWNALCKEQKNA